MRTKWTAIAVLTSIILPNGTNAADGDDSTIRIVCYQTVSPGDGAAEVPGFLAITNQTDVGAVDIREFFSDTPQNTQVPFRDDIRSELTLFYDAPAVSTRSDWQSVVQEVLSSGSGETRKTTITRALDTITVSNNDTLLDFQGHKAQEHNIFIDNARGEMRFIYCFPPYAIEVAQ